MCRVYLSGPITGKKDYKQAFFHAELEMLRIGYEVVNPARLDSCLPELRHEEYMRIDIALLSVCDMIAMLPGWRDSKGAKMEYEYASTHGMKIIYLGSDGRKPRQRPHVAFIGNSYMNTNGGHHEV